MNILLLNIPKLPQMFTFAIKQVTESSELKNEKNEKEKNLSILNNL